MNFVRKLLFCGLLGFCLSSVAEYPQRPIRLIVPAAPGGAIDVVGRLVAQRLGVILSQNVVVDNRAGANYIIGSDLVAKSPADGYTLLVTAGGHTINPVVYKKLPYDTFRDFTPISLICNSSGLVVTVHPSVNLQNLQQLIDYAKVNPGKMIFVSAGWGNSTHLAGELFQVMAQVKFTHVPYRSAGPAITDLLGGQVPLMFAPSPVVVPMVQAGRLRALAFTGLKRSPQLPLIPTVDESGLPGYESTGWYGIYGPRGLPAVVVKRLNEAIVKIVHLNEVLERFNSLNLEAIGSTVEEFSQFLHKDYERYVMVAKVAHIEPQ
jgi:tripartite-type tricarboxylate transporter receptor subunit TctC